jgi:hypothetical protein
MHVPPSFYINFSRLVGTAPNKALRFVMTALMPNFSLKTEEKNTLIYDIMCGFYFTLGPSH